MPSEREENGVSASVQPGQGGGRVVTLPGVTLAGDVAPEPDHGWFRPLGFNRGRFFFLGSRGRQIRDFSASALAASSNAALLELAPLSFWEREFPSESGFTGRAVKRAVDWLLDACYAAGPFRAEQIRGRGCWDDDGRVVIHLGGRLLVDGQECALSDLDTRFVYESLAPLAVDVGGALGAGDGEVLHRLCRSLAWENGDLDATLFAGWATIAIASGALAWRPHLFLSGPAGCGKTTLARAILQLLGEFAVGAKGDTSAAGIRQRMGQDALPLVFDEADPDGPHALESMNRVLALLRASSADFEGDVLKGGASGEATGYALRSMAMLVGIRSPIQQQSDETRITVLSLRKPRPADQRRFQSETLPLLAEVTAPAFAARFRARVFARLGDLRQNVRVFAQAAGAHLGSQRLGDQVGPLLAGAWLLYRDGIVSAEAAQAWVARQAWPDQKRIAQSSDEERLVLAILEARVAVNVQRTRYDASIGELVGLAAGRWTHAFIGQSDANAELQRHGLMVDGHRVLISNTHRGLAQLLAGTPWAVGWDGVLRRLDGAEVLARRPYFAGARSRALALPLDAVLGAADEGKG